MDIIELVMDYLLKMQMGLSKLSILNDMQMLLKIIQLVIFQSLNYDLIVFDYVLMHERVH